MRRVSTALYEASNREGKVYIRIWLPQFSVKKQKKKMNSFACIRNTFLVGKKNLSTLFFLVWFRAASSFFLFSISISDAFRKVVKEFFAAHESFVINLL